MEAGGRHSGKGGPTSNLRRLFSFYHMLKLLTLKSTVCLIWGGLGSWPAPELGTRADATGSVEGGVVSGPSGPSSLAAPSPWGGGLGRWWQTPRVQPENSPGACSRLVRWSPEAWHRGGCSRPCLHWLGAPGLGRSSLPDPTVAVLVGVQVLPDTGCVSLRSHFTSLCLSQNWGGRTSASQEQR